MNNLIHIMKIIQMKLVIILIQYYEYKSKNFDNDYKKFKEILKFCGGRIEAVWNYVDLKIQYKEKIGEKIDEIQYRNYDS